ncbi:hypothetical protein Rhe02_92480 [Rhizocola hellebori]|uniref:Secreted protein n=1 Tax=Rhizocola hellebori TaxID=1392758 RepID=A0A8J3QLB7_9ACTN|nr:hypothetical protein [Rhizocola hellebori]GIH11181.1 hypothetical protein Rhe02_92480 [Rhizocola hellebori]
MRQVLKKLAAVTAVIMSATLIAAAPAAAAPTDTMSCTNGPYLWHTTAFNVCIRIGNYNSGDWQVHVGLDITPEGYARDAILNCPANFSAELWGADTDRTPGLQWSLPSGDDDYRTFVPVSPGWPAVGPGGLGVEFDKTVDWRVLNEDDGTDEIYVLIKFNDCSSDFNPIMIRTDNIVHNF